MEMKKKQIVELIQLLKTIDRIQNASTDWYIK